MIIKTIINPDVIKNLNEEQLDALVYNKAIDKYLGTFGERLSNSAQDNALLEMLACSVFNTEVCNGGFDQFFLNAADLTQAAIKGLMNIKAEAHCNLLITAVKIYQEQKELYENKRNPNFDPLDKQYYQLNDLENYRRKFIRENIEIFFD